MVIKKSIAIRCFIILFITLIAIAINNAGVLTIATLICWTIGFVYSVRDIKLRFTMFSFHLGFFVFLLGGFVFYWLRNGDFGYFANPESTIEHTCRALLLSISTYNVFSLIFRNRPEKEDVSQKEKRKEKELIFTEKQKKTVSQIIIALLVISFICELLIEVRTTIIIRATSYALSMSVDTGLPTLITSFGSLYYIVLFLYWGMLPSKKGFYISASTLILLEIVILFSGERGEPISLMFTILFYILLRNRRGVKDILIKKSVVVTALITIPFVLVSLQTLSYTRVKKEYSADVTTGVSDFFESQGGTAKIIANGYDLKDRISEMGGHTFVFGTVRNYLKTNIFTRYLFGLSKSTRTVADAYSGNSYLATYGYAYSPVTYKRFVGSGSTYIAEVFQDGGYFFLMLFNVFIAFLNYKIDRFEEGSIISTAIVLNVFRYMVLLPRGVALQWLTSTFAIQNILLFLFLYVVLYRKKDSIEPDENVETESDSDAVIKENVEH